MSIATFLNNSKKREILQITLRMMEQKIQKKLREGSVRSCKVDAADVFAEGLDNSSCQTILFKLLKGVRGKISKSI